MRKLKQREARRHASGHTTGELTAGKGWGLLTLGQCSFQNHSTINLGFLTAFFLNVKIYLWRASHQHLVNAYDGPLILLPTGFNPKFLLTRLKKLIWIYLELWPLSLFWSQSHNQSIKTSSLKAWEALKYSWTPHSFVHIQHYPWAVQCSKCPSTVKSCLSHIFRECI